MGEELLDQMTARNRRRVALQRLGFAYVQLCVGWRECRAVALAREARPGMSTRVLTRTYLKIPS